MTMKKKLNKSYILLIWIIAVIENSQSATNVLKGFKCMEKMLENPVIIETLEISLGDICADLELEFR